MIFPPLKKIDRRSFVGSTIAALSAATFSFKSDAAYSNNADDTILSLTVQDIINLVLKNVAGAPFAQTVDTLKAGKADQVVTGIVTTMFATIKVIQTAIELNANFIIAHEPAFYNHHDDTTVFENDSVYKYKRDLLDRNSIAIWRCHDYIHSLHPDGVLTGVLATLGWEKFYDPLNPMIITIPPSPLEKVVEYLKEKIGAPHVKVCGVLSQSCSRIALMPGAAGGRRQIQIVMDQHPDLLVCGEISEWETVEYIRDALASGASRSLVVLGHALSEEPGMKWMAGWLAPQVQALKVTHVASGDPFRWA